MKVLFYRKEKEYGADISIVLMYKNNWKFIPKHFKEYS